MKLFLILTVNFVDLILTAVLFAMLIRALLSIFMMGEESKFAMILYYFTEPFIIPVRMLLQKLNLPPLYLLNLFPQCQQGKKR